MSFFVSASIQKAPKKGQRVRFDFLFDFRFLIEDLNFIRENTDK
jgi:hypothetical protein